MHTRMQVRELALLEWRPRKAHRSLGRSSPAIQGGSHIQTARQCRQLSQSGMAGSERWHNPIVHWQSRRRLFEGKQRVLFGDATVRHLIQVHLCERDTLNRCLSVHSMSPGVIGGGGLVNARGELHMLSDCPNASLVENTLPLQRTPGELFRP
ncbi:hypothetical protein P154DRAFT_270032 [Amniculicola lignicola CBS 123094]|uniref:Uncharacterized protein n=1 Tax=Amniculicola lignicola CBS 123094 TaxID=1392246 RepID=A0A6A5WAI7_9PLEO|nr:hypothetical protein P154DRAFT_270032 [Amniculicola lignicola CBS 123094]